MWPQGILGRGQWLVIDVFWPILCPTLQIPASGDSRGNQTASAYLSIMKTAKSRSTQQPISNVPEMPLSQNTAVSPKTDQIIQTDVSFSSYLKPDEFKGSSLNDAELNIFDAQKYFSECSDQILSNSKRVSPLKENVSDPSMYTRYCSASSVDGFGRNFRLRSFRSCETPKTSSEASWNSQTGLLSNPSELRSVSRRDPTRKQRKRGYTFPKWLLCRSKCPCSDKKSVQVVERPPKTRSPMHINNQNVKDVVHLKRQHENATGKAGTAGAIESNEISSKTDYHPSLHGMKKAANYDSHPRFFIPNSQGKLSSGTENHFAKPEHGISRVTVSAPPKPLTDSASAGFTFPVLSPSSSLSKPPKKLLLTGSSTPTKSSSPPTDPPKDSLEVFQPPGEARISTKLKEIYNHQCHQLLQSASGLSSDNHSTRVPESLKTETGNVSANEDDGDGESDASSDLFEIESFSTLSTSQLVQRRQRNSFGESKTTQIAT